MKIRESVNKFPDFVRYAVGRLKTLCPTMGKQKIAQMLCRAGLHLGATTVGRMLHEIPPATSSQSAVSNGPTVSAKAPNQVWHVDLTAVETNSGF